MEMSGYQPKLRDVSESLKAYNLLLKHICQVDSQITEINDNLLLLEKRYGTFFYFFSTRQHEFCYEMSLMNAFQYMIRAIQTFGNTTVFSCSPYLLKLQLIYLVNGTSHMYLEYLSLSPFIIHIQGHMIFFCFWILFCCGGRLPSSYCCKLYVPTLRTDTFRHIMGQIID